jgi:KUP system potassium uptake protein
MHKSSLAALALGTIGVVYGDIGTSPLYAMGAIFATKQAQVNPQDILGVLSLIFWTLTIIVSLKYVVLVMRAHNNGEGGTVALMALASSATRRLPRTRTALIMMGIIGAALFYGDGVITPAISVLGAIEGLEVATPAFKPYIVPLTVAVLSGLYFLQRRGTGAVGKLFGPIMVVWFVVLGATGVYWIAQQPQVLAALNPMYALRFAEGHLIGLFIILGAVFLTVTGAEALYADMGHFGAKPIRLAWFTLVMPALVLHYFGEGALLLVRPEAVSNPLFNMVPQWAVIPMVVLATAAAVIASQATISGAFSVTKQAIQLGYLPRLTVLHTSIREVGQIYIPAINWLQYGAVLVAVIGFGSSAALGAAYGIAVTGTMVLTTIMTFYVVRYRWNYPLALCIGATGFFLAIELIFFASNILKVHEGGWFTLLIAAMVFVLMMTWKQGRMLLSRRLRADALELKPFLDSVFESPPARVEGTAVFLSAEPGITPPALLHNLKHNKVLHDTNLFVTVKSHEVPWVPFDKRVEVEPLGHCCWQVTLNFGFKNEPDVPEALAMLRDRGIDIDEMSTSYFLSREIVVPTMGEGMAPWREKLFAGMHRNASAAADFLSLPVNRVVELGSKVTI